MDEEALKQRLADFIRRIWDEGDADAADEFVAETYTIHHDPGDRWHGMTLDLAGFKERVRTSRASFPDQKFDIQGMFANGRDIAMTWFWAATHAGDIPGFPATGKTIRMSGATVYGFDAQGRLTGHWQIVDRLGVYQQLQKNLAG
ncbi:ester cyclase [Stakelama marina]|uniref:Ester cyclase n=1 Tax=Stakelama marina TaxID=2826939 RepID=A0A8T4ID53_9SPHN|nr:ester cyclase [Stakelama marina]MBR0552321.1 ester cyclase [Stakelama marina]